jgi:hypothetical protein
VLPCPAQCLYSNGGYTYLDVRSALEVDEVGKVKDSVNIPFVICTRVWDPEQQKKVIKKENNGEFVAQVCGLLCVFGISWAVLGCIELRRQRRAVAAVAATQQLRGKAHKPGLPSHQPLQRLPRQLMQLALPDCSSPRYCTDATALSTPPHPPR